MKLSLGTVQFGNNYGVSNKTGIVSYNEAEKILTTARESGIKMLDTANSYGESENILGEIGVNDFDVVSKIKILEGSSIDQKIIENNIISTLKKLRIESLYALLIHNTETLDSKDAKKIFDILAVMKKNKLIQKIGISIYNSNNIEQLVDDYKFDVIQAPINIFDRQLNYNSRLELLKKENIEIHARSIFLQGLLLMNSKMRPNYFNSWKNLFKAYDKWTAENNILPIEACLKFVSNVSLIDRIVVGVQSNVELKQIINLNLKHCIDVPDEIQSNDTKLINPFNWNL